MRRDVGLVGLVALGIGLATGLGLNVERVTMRVVPAVESGEALKACSAACAADLRTHAALSVEAVERAEARVEALRVEMERAWRTCAVPGAWMDGGVLPLPWALMATDGGGE